MKKKISLFLGVLFLDLTAFLISSTCVSLSWFNKGFNIKFDNQTGKSLANYFASGDGTKDKPYTITESIHFYNFAWLQYLGEFNKNATGTDSINQKYFRLDKDINMSDIVIPPVGTVTYPFVGNFDGNDKTINNLTVSNTFNDFGAKHPSVVNAENFETINIVGTFGVVGNLSTNFKYDTTINEVAKLYLDNVTLRTNTPNLLVGIFAGYVNGNINNCGVHYSKIEIANKTQYYLTNDETVNGYINKNISNYTLLGAYNNASYYWDGEPGFDNDGVGFGGSVDMTSFNKRLGYISAVSNKTIAQGGNASYDDSSYSFHGYTTTTLPWNWNDTRLPSYYIGNGTILPLNIDSTIAFANPSKDSDGWESTPFYRNNSNEFEITLNSNTGYLVGNGEKSDNSTIRSRIVKIQECTTYNKSGICDSLNNNVYDGNKIKIFSVDTRKDNNRIIVDENNYNSQFGYTRYKEVKSDFDLTMDKSTTIHGFHFMNQIDLANPVKTMNSNKIKICKKEYEPNTYEFVPGALNFTVEKEGFITSISGGYYNNYSKESLFELFRVERNNGKIISLKKVNKIYKNGNKTILNYEGEQASSLGELLFDFTKITGDNACLDAFKAYYFEFPVVPGDYVIGKNKDSDSRNAYLMYLDIGANASLVEETRKALTNVDFVDTVDENGEKKLMRVNPSNLSKVAFKISGTFDNDYTYYFRRRGDIVYYSSYCLDVRLFNFIQPSNTGKKEKSDSDCEISVE